MSTLTSPDLQAMSDPITEPIPIIAGRPKLRDTFSALSAYNYRLYLISQLFANTGGWMARVAIDWLVLELTGNVALVGLTVTLQFAPTLLIGPWAGVISDRARRRHVLLLTQSVGTVAFAALAAVVLLGVVQVWQVYLVAVITGISMAVDMPSRSAFVSEMVGTHRLRNAISLNASIFHLGGLIGPAISGVLIVAIGSGWSIAVNAVTSAIAVLALALMRSRELVPSPRQSAKPGQIREAMRYMVGKPTILWPTVLLAAVATFGMNLPVLFTASATTYGTGAAGYGLYSSLAAMGAFIGAMLSSQRRTLRLRAIVAACIIYGIVTMIAGFTFWYPLFLGAIAGIGVARLLFAATAESMTQLSTNLGIRGRVMSFYLMVAIGGQAAGGLIIGFIAQHYGSEAAFFVSGAVPAITGIAVGIVVARRHQMRISVNLRSPRRMFRIETKRQVLAG